ncbi:MAG: aminomethyl-transferring glycine dehydrogenase subunit GcvPA [Acidiferrobacterales bacterium]
MPFIPHNKKELAEMLEVIGVKDIDSLFDEIPAALRNDTINMVPPAASEMEVRHLMSAHANTDGQYINFIGAGAYEHHIPAAVWELTTRGEFYTAYTPYQAEASQGTLQVIYEFQSMIAGLTAMDVANASLYEGASALAEAVLMAVRCHKKSQRILIPETVHPLYRQTVKTIVQHQNIEIVDIPYSKGGGFIDPQDLDRYASDQFAALVIPQPNFFGVLEEVDTLTDWAHVNGALAIGLVNPVAMAILAPPGEWGEAGADIAVGEGQPLGAPLASGGPYFGFLACRQKLVRQMPGRIIGRTVDLDGKPGFTLTLQAREQHIRRSKATSNICTNQGLLATAATIHMALLGREGLERVASSCHANTTRLIEVLTAIDGVDVLFDRPVFHEVALKINAPIADVIRALEAQGVIAGYALGEAYPELDDVLLVCATETRTEDDIQLYYKHLERVVSKRRLDPPCAVKVNPDV